MGIITLTSDWGLRDYYVAAVKGMIFKHLPEAKVVDITHLIDPFDVVEAAYVLKNAYSSFPRGTVHIIGINTEESLEHPHTVAKFEGQYFIGADIGIFSLIFSNEAEALIELDIPQESEHFTFSTRDRFVKAAVHLAKGGDLSDLGPAKSDLVTKILFEPAIDEHAIRGLIMHIDTYENLVTNISEEVFRQFVKGHNFQLSFRNHRYKVTEIQDSYSDVRPGEIVALFASNNMLEIAINKGKAASLLGIRKKDPLLIEITDPKSTG